MTNIQKVIKYLALALAIFLAVSIFAGIFSALGIVELFSKTNAVAEATKTYAVQSQILSLRVQINAADFTIKESDKFAVESNLKYLTVSEHNGTLIVKEDKKHAYAYTDAVLTLYIPAGTVFERMEITTGAAKLTADALAANVLDLELGAGDVRIGTLTAFKEADIEGGAGKITVEDGTMRNLDLEMGVGELNLTAALLGESDLAFGVGESNLTLLGGQSDYKVEIEKGIGSITVNGKPVTDFGIGGNGANRVDIEGGIGAIHVKFEDQ